MTCSMAVSIRGQQRLLLLKQLMSHDLSCYLSLTLSDHKPRPFCLDWSVMDVQKLLPLRLRHRYSTIVLY